MRIVVDTNVVISGVFFGGAPRRVVEAVTTVEVCREPDDDKFIGCAIDSKPLFIVSGDKDLLTPGGYEGIEMITAADFCKRYL